MEIAVVWRLLCRVAENIIIDTDSCIVDRVVIHSVFRKQSLEREKSDGMI